MPRTKIRYPHSQQHRVEMALEKINTIIWDCKDRGAETHDMQTAWSNLLDAHHDMQIIDGQ